MDLKSMPKVDLHVHLDGGLQLDTLIKLADLEGIDLPAKNSDVLREWMQVDQNCRSLKEYLKRFERVNPLLQSEKALELAAHHIVRDAAIENVKYMEVRFAPTLHQKKGLNTNQVIEAVLKGLKAGEEEYGILARGIISCIRDEGLAVNLDLVETARSFIGKGIVGFDLAGNEKDYPVSVYQPLFSELKEQGIPYTIHAGEADGPESVRAAIDLGSSRIGHGVSAAVDKGAMSRLEKEAVVLELCPTSNLQTKAISDFKMYPIRRFMKAGVRVTVNTDNPSISGTSITREWEVVQRQFSLTVPEIKAIVMNGVYAAFLEKEEKERLLAEIEQDFSCWEKENGK